MVFTAAAPRLQLESSEEMFLEERKGSELTELCPLSATPWIVAHQVPPPMGFSRQEYWSGFPTQGSNLGLPHCRQMLYHLSHQGSPSMTHSYVWKLTLTVGSHHSRSYWLNSLHKASSSALGFLTPWCDSESVNIREMRWKYAEFYDLA